jgi:glutamate-ammonia-ligase adenylyltransferase
MKARAEAELRKKGLDGREVKRGPGGIRDIEFAVQLLQRVHGRHDASIRSANTLEALAQLVAGEYVEPGDAERLSAAYRFLRTVEHRLQLWDEQQTHTLPVDSESRLRLVRVLGYRDQPRRSAVELFDADHRAHQSTVRSIHERLFFAPVLDALAGAGPLPPGAVEDRLAAFGFMDTRQTRAALQELTRGLTRRSRVMQQLLPVIFDWLSASPDPDLGLLQLRRLAEGPTRARALAATFREQPGTAERVCRILGSSRLIGDALLHQPEVLELLGEDDWLGRPRDPEELTAAALDTLRWRADPQARRAGLRRFKRSELLRIAGRDLVGLATSEATARELADLADACLRATVAALEPDPPFAVIGMGRLGGCELSYASDIDVLFVYAGDGAADFAAAEATATAVMTEIGATTSEGQTFRIDANLRPEGKQGPLARSLDGYRHYYERYALPWEFQSLLRARPVAGDEEVAQRFLELVEPFVYRDPFPDDAVREIRRIKARVERERIPPGEDPEFHLKLGKGSLSDVEFTVQLLQLQHGASHPHVRAQATMEAIDRLRAAHLLDDEDATVLAEAYRFCERARNARYLVTAQPNDSLPTGDAATKMARLMGYTHRPDQALRDDYKKLTRRARRVVERLFYATDST